jgi:hypothetical protein
MFMGTGEHYRLDLLPFFPKKDNLNHDSKDENFSFS